MRILDATHIFIHVLFSRSCHPICLLKGLAGPDSSGMSLQYPYHRSKDIADHPGAGEAQSQCGQGELGPTNF